MERTWTNTGSLLVGNSGTGTLTISNGGTVNVAGGTGTVTLGNSAGGAGTLNIGAAASGPAAAGGILAATTVTTGSGAGTVQFNTTAGSGSPYYFTTTGTSGGAAIAITGSTQVANTGGFNVLTGAKTYTGATTVNGGTLEIGGGGALQNSSITNNGGSFIVATGASVGGTGSFLQSSGSSEIDGSLTLGSMQIQGGSLLDTGQVAISGDASNSGAITVDGPSANFTVEGFYTQTGGSMILGDGGTFDPGAIDIFGGIFGGDGTVIGDVTVDGGTLQVGEGFNIQGNYTQVGGSIVFDINPNGSGGFTESQLTFDPTAAVSIDDLNIVLDFMGGSNPTAFADDGLDTLGTFLNVGQFGGDFHGITYSEKTPDASETWAIFLCGLAGIAAMKRRSGNRMPVPPP